MNLKLLIVANNLESWTTWQQKLNDIHWFFYPQIDFTIDIKHVSFDSIPFVPVPGTFRQIDQQWYNENVLPLAEGYDICLFAVDRSVWPAEVTDPKLCLHGWETGENNFIVTAEAGADENMVAGGRPGENPSFYNAFEHTVEHEVMHALFSMVYGQNGNYAVPEDSTHKFDYVLLNLAGALGDLPKTFIGPQQRKQMMLSVIVACKNVIPLLQTLISQIMVPTKIEKLAGCIRDYEGQPGDRNYRNCNPGNCRFNRLGYLPKYGNVTQDKDGFAVFPTYAQGWQYLCNMLTNWAKGTKAEYTVLELMKEYAPTSDGNDPSSYAQNITNKMGLSAQTKLKDLCNT